MRACSKLPRGTIQRNPTGPLHPSTQQSLSSRIQQLELATGAGGPAPGPQGEKHPLLAALKPSAAGLEAEQLQAERDKVRCAGIACMA